MYTTSAVSDLELDLHHAQRNKMYCVHFTKKFTFRFFKLKDTYDISILIRTLVPICIRYQNSFIVYLCTNYHFISFMNKMKSICFLFVICFCTICIVYWQNRSVNIHFACNGQAYPEATNIGEV